MTTATLSPLNPEAIAEYQRLRIDAFARLAQLDAELPSEVVMAERDRLKTLVNMRLSEWLVQTGRA